MANKKERIQALIQKNISDIILFELKKPIMKLVTVNFVEVTNDHSHAKIYISHLDKKKINEALDELNHLKGVIRSSLARKMDLYHVHELHFLQDDTYEKGQHIEEILKNLK